MRLAAIVLARMDSSRLPGKAMKTVKGLPLIHYVLSRAQRIPGAEVVLATTDRAGDDILEGYASRIGVKTHRGSATDVAGRLLAAATACGASHFVRVNGDSVFADPELIAEGVSRCGEADFVTNLAGRTFPYGIAVEILRTEAYRRAYAGIATAHDREHPTSCLYANLAQFAVAKLVSPHPELQAARLVVDTSEDLDNFRRLAAELGERVLAIGYREAAELYLELTATR